MASKRLPRKSLEHLAKARESCLAAVAAYNNPTVEFRSGTYIVLIIIAWTSLFHAIYYRNRVKPWRVLSGEGKGTRYDRIGSDYKHWELNECLRRYFAGEWNAVRENLRFLIGLRDRIEHRAMPELDHVVFGECQAALLNFEALLVSEFGEEMALNTSLAFSLQFSGVVPERRQLAMEALRKSGTDSVVNYVNQFRSELALEVANDQRFAFKVFLIPQLANHRTKDTLAVEWLPIEEIDPTVVEDFDRAIVLIKQRHIAVRNPGKFLPNGVVQVVSGLIPWRFRLFEHTRCWKHFAVRPAEQVDAPDKCDSKYCQWDPAFHRYVYTDAWVEMLATKLKEPSGFEEVIGTAPVLMV